MSDDDAKTDPNHYTELWSSNPGDYYADTIALVNDGPALRLSAAGRVVHCSIRDLIDAVWPKEFPKDTT